MRAGIYHKKHVIDFIEADLEEVDPGSVESRSPYERLKFELLSGNSRNHA